MSDQQIGVLELLAVAKEAELKAAQFYSESAEKISNPLGKKLFATLSEFEQFHFQKLSALETSLREKGAYFAYEGRDLELGPLHEVKQVEKERPSVMEIITKAIETEDAAMERYRKLAEMIDDKDGHAMCLKLAEEEKMHGRILRKAYWSLNDRGVWDLSA
jgi:rubrerythrin